MSSPVAVITGSGRERIGNVIAGDLADRGYDIAIHYHSSADEARQTVEKLRAGNRQTGNRQTGNRQTGGDRNRAIRAEAFKANVGDESQVDAMFDAIMAQFGRIDVLVNTASIWKTIAFEKTTAEDIRNSFDVNALGTFLCSRRAGLAMAEQESGGSIITIGDWSIERPYLDHAAYFIAKGSLPTMTRLLAVELGHRNPNVRVNCIHPGPVMFPPGSSDAERQKSLDATLLKKADRPDAMASAVRFLIENDFLTGVCLPVDAGRTIFTPMQISETGL